VCLRAVPLEIPQKFHLNPDKEVTSTTADFIWGSVDTSPYRMQGGFRGYKVRLRKFLFLSLCSIYTVWPKRPVHFHLPDVKLI